jgi:excisionase family DNA binding protein
MSEPSIKESITTREAQALTGYDPAYIRHLAKQGKILARKVGRDWLIDLASLQAYKQQMDTLGDQRHNPWREDLAAAGRGRAKEATDEQHNDDHRC